MVDVGRYGFVMLKYYMPPHGFEEDETYTDSRALFEGLWQEWLDMKLYLMAKGTPLLEKGYKGAFESLPEEKQSILIGRKAAFAFPQAVNGVFHSSIASYAHFHDAVLNVLFS